MESKKHCTNELIYKTGIASHRHRTNLWLPKGMGEEIKQEVGHKVYTLLYKNKQGATLYGIGALINILLITYNESEE